MDFDQHTRKCKFRLFHTSVSISHTKQQRDTSQTVLKTQPRLGPRACVNSGLVLDPWKSVPRGGCMESLGYRCRTLTVVVVVVRGVALHAPGSYPGPGVCIHLHTCARSMISPQTPPIHAASTLSKQGGFRCVFTAPIFCCHGNFLQEVGPDLKGCGFTGQPHCQILLERCT